MTNDTLSFDVSSDEFRRLGQRTIDVMLRAIDLEQRDPVFKKPSGAHLAALFDEPVPEEGCSPDEVIDLWQSTVLPHCRRNGHPRFFGYVCTSADPIGMLADAVASALNQPVTAWRSSPGTTTVERQVLRWLDEITGFLGGGNGVMTSGGSMANFQAMACAVYQTENRCKLPSGARHQLTVYLSTEGHISMRKAARLLGIPDGHVRIIPVDANRRLQIRDLESQIEQDKQSGLFPAVVCASAGTANTGAIDPLGDIADLCRSAEIWFHIDGSYGAPAALTSDYEWMKEPFRRADSLSLDPHKWLFAPVDAGCVLVKNDEALRASFSMESEYTTVTETDPTERFAFFDRSLEMSRRFRALKVWSILKVRGVGAVRSAIAHDIALRKQLDHLVMSNDRLQLLGSELSISCFRYVPKGPVPAGRVNALNERIVRTLTEQGRFYMSPTILDGVYSLRVCVVNFRTTTQDIDELVTEVLRIGDAG